MALETLLKRYRELSASGRILPNSVESVRVQLTYHSNALEGSTLSLPDTQLVVEGREPNSGKSLREIYEARNLDRALRQIESRLKSSHTEPILDHQESLDVHAAVMADIDTHSAGRFRTDRVLITGTRFVPPGSYKFGELIPAMIALANRVDEHPAILAAEPHYNFVAIHPFGDGNGRTARLLVNAFLLARGYPHTIITVGKRAEYLAALESANAGDSTPFATFVSNASLIRFSSHRLRVTPP